MLLPWTFDGPIPWLETQQAKQWAWNELSSVPPPLHSEQRQETLSLIRRNTDRINDICIDSFWRSDDPCLEDEARRLKHRIEQEKARIGLWRLLPNELISLIFEFARGAEVKRFVVGHTFSQVCRRWRDIAISTPKCWADLHVSEQGVGVSLLRTWIERSNNTLLTVQLIETKAKDKLTVLYPQFPRVRRLEVVPQLKYYHFIQGIVDLDEFEQPVAAEAGIQHALSEAAALVELILPRGLFRGYSFPNHQISLPSVQSLHLLGSSDLGGFSPSNTLRFIAIKDTEGRSDFGTIMSRLATSFEHVETLDLVSWTPLYLDRHRIGQTVHQGVHNLLCSETDKTNMNLSLMLRSFSSLTSLSITTAHLPAETDLPYMEGLLSLTIRNPEVISPKEQLVYEQWVLQAPDLRHFVLGSTIWVTQAACHAIVDDIYNRKSDDPFSWSNLDQGRLYAWPHPWCIALAKRDELRLYEHFLCDCKPQESVLSQSLPYRINLSWLELKTKVEALLEVV